MPVLRTPRTALFCFEYADEMKTELNSGANNLPVSRGFGNVVASASITLHMDDIELLRASIPSGRLQDLGIFDVIVSYAHPETAKQVSHTIVNCFLNENGVSVGQDDTLIEKQLNLNPAHIFWNDKLIVGLGIV